MTQTMTPESRARAVIYKINWGQQHKSWESLIAAAIRDAENSALDRAAAKADRWFNHEMKLASAFEKHGKTEAAATRISCSAIAALIEGDILDLKSPQHPEPA